jgi:hypothetical protein
VRDLTCASSTECPSASIASARTRQPRPPCRTARRDSPERRRYPCAARSLRRAAQALVDIAEQFKCSWLQLWALNKDISRPEGYGVEGSINEGDIIHIGQLVLVKRGDTLEKIAARFGTTLRQIVALNADISPTEPLVTGQLVCLVPSSCTERTV